MVHVAFTTGTRARAVACARRFLGCRYWWGAKVAPLASLKYFDCSSLASVCGTAAGYWVPGCRGTVSTFAASLQSLEPSQVEPGDFVLFTAPGGSSPCHIGVVSEVEGGEPAQFIGANGGGSGTVGNDPSAVVAETGVDYWHGASVRYARAREPADDSMGAVWAALVGMREAGQLKGSGPVGAFTWEQVASFVGSYCV